MELDNRVIVSTTDVAKEFKDEIQNIEDPWLKRARDKLGLRNLRSDILAIAHEIEYIAQQTLFRIISTGKICRYRAKKARLENKLDTLEAKRFALVETLGKVPKPEQGVLSCPPPSWKQRILPLILAFIIDLHLVQGAYYFLGQATALSWMVASAQAGVLLYLGMTAGEYARAYSGKRKWYIVIIITIVALSLFLIMSLILVQVMEYQQGMIPSVETPSLPWYTFLMFWLVNVAGFAIAAFSAYRTTWTDKEHKEYAEAIDNDNERKNLQKQIQEIDEYKNKLEENNESEEGQVYTEIAWAAEYADLVDSAKASVIQKFIAETGKETPVDDPLFPRFDRVKCVDVLRNMLFKSIYVVLLCLITVSNIQGQSEHITLLIDHTEANHNLISDTDIRQFLLPEDRVWDKTSIRVVEISDIVNGDIYESHIKKGNSLWNQRFPRMGEFRKMVDKVIRDVSLIKNKPETSYSTILQVILRELHIAERSGADRIRFVVASDLKEHTRKCSLYDSDDRAIFKKEPELVCEILGIDTTSLKRADIELEVIYRPNSTEEDDMINEILTGYKKLLQGMGVSISLQANLQKRKI